MANPEHVKIVKQGAEAIAAWRKENPCGSLDLTAANLSGADLFAANLYAAYLRGADLTGANLRGADLTGAILYAAHLFVAHLVRANLSGADLTAADFTRADLTVADLTRANLSGAHLTAADLTRANLISTMLGETDLTNASVGFTTFADCDLSRVKGLHTVRHSGPSSIGIDTIIRSDGKIPPQFLEGAGVPDTWIEYMPSLIPTYPVPFYSAFLSHSHKNEEFVEKLHGNLRDKKIRVWYFPSDARGGRRLEGEIHGAIRYYDKVMVICSKQALASEAVRDEIDQAVQKQKENPDQWILLPIAIDDAVYTEDSEFARRLRRNVIEDFRKWREQWEYEYALEKLVRDLAAKERPAG